MESVRTLLTEIIDYAGLFPPSGLGMTEAVEHYANHLNSKHRWMLGRFVCPVTAIEDFDAAATDLLPKGETDDPWRLSGIVAPESLSEQIDRIFRFNDHHETVVEAGRCVIDVIETKASSASDIERIMKIVPEQIEPFIELNHTTDLRGIIAAIAGTGGRAKIRCGGVTPKAIPTAEQIARFIANCAAAEVSFKFTAGLHHPVRAEQNLTYVAQPPRAMMHGFLNVFTAATMARVNRLGEPELVQILQETDPKAFIFTEGGLTWHEHFAPTARLARVRESFAISVGSCSFTEPVDDLIAIGLLEREKV
ncbi:MAG: hypothetical protein ACNA8P_04445 [Phycisphaerales bacterium]